MKGIILATIFISLKSMAIDAANFTGEYSQGSQINFVGATDEKSCKADAPDAEWNGKACLATKDNKLSISKISDLQDKYLAQISIIGGNIHTCDFAGVMTQVDNKLVYQDVIPDTTQICRIEIESIEGGIKLSAMDSCSQFYCGFGLTLSGTNKAFKRTGEGRELTSEDAQKQAEE